MSNTPAYHARYLAHELTSRTPADGIEKLAAILLDARVDLNPHQVEAALFAFRSPLSKGAILADEVGLGKTIEAGMVMAQRWAERNRRILVIAPANLRKQWSQELADKFYLPSVILETGSFNEAIRQKNLNPFGQAAIVICSYQFAYAKAAFLENIDWHLVVIDEAHRLRNVYKPSNKIGRAIRDSLGHAPKILLTATPLQNSLMELYGLVSIIDEYAFGDVKSFREQYGRLSDESDPALFAELKQRLQPVCQRTLRRQVLEYINYTERRAMVEEFFPTADEQLLYDQVSDYLRQTTLYALPPGQRQLMTLILRKLLASSSFAIAGTLTGLATKLSQRLDNQQQRTPNAIPTPDSEPIADAFETYPELADEYADDTPPVEPDAPYTPVQRAEVEAEIKALKGFAALARTIAKNSKGEKLRVALEKGFAEAHRRGADRKAIIFTESTRTQQYIQTLLVQHGYDPADLVLFNGSNTDPQSQQIYRSWLARHGGSGRVSGSKTADMRAALVDYFRERAQVMIATEAAAEGINLQFCALVVNYDMPWNPQRIEQRIGRCHRYGQKHDVVVVNFLNKANAADVRIYELLDQKFNLFSGVFGASDEVLGSIESGIDFEKRIARIYQECRTADTIRAEFDALQRELEGQINTELNQTRQKLLEHFDQEVTEKLRINLRQSRELLSRYETNLWKLTRHFLHDYATFDNADCRISLHRSPVAGAPAGTYRLSKTTDGTDQPYRTGHPLAQWVLQQGCDVPTPDAHLTFAYTPTAGKVSALEALLGQRGWLAVTKFTFTSFETTDRLVLTGFAESGTVLEPDTVARLLAMPVTIAEATHQPPAEAVTTLDDLIRRDVADWRARLEIQNADWLAQETQKLNAWADDRIRSAERDIRDVKNRIQELNRNSRRATSPATQLAIQKELNDLTRQQKKLRQQIFTVEDDIEQQRDRLIADIEARMKNQLSHHRLFTLRWTLTPAPLP